MESLNFGDHYKFIKGTEILIDFKGRKVLIFDINNKQIETLYFSKGIKNKFTIDDLLNYETRVGDLLYSVLLNGYQNKNWLWCGEISSIE